MDKSTVSQQQQQEKVNAHFRSQSSYWNEIYARNTLNAEIYRARQATALAWIDDLALAPGSRVLDVGCGAGFLSVALAQRGLRVHAIDPVENMVELARRHAAEVGVAELLTVDIGDVNALAFEDASFGLVTAHGVTSWLARPELAMQEMARVTMPGGYVLLTDGNRVALHLLLDPWKNLALAPLRRGIRGVLERVGILQHSPKPVMAAVRRRRLIDGALASAGLSRTRCKTLGEDPSRSCTAGSSPSVSVSHCTIDYSTSPIETRHSCALPACPTLCWAGSRHPHLLNGTGGERREARPGRCERATA